jgi:hypothetical protein
MMLVLLGRRGYEVVNNRSCINIVSNVTAIGQWMIAGALPFTEASCSRLVPIPLLPQGEATSN